MQSTQTQSARQSQGQGSEVLPVRQSESAQEAPQQAATQSKPQEQGQQARAQPDQGASQVEPGKLQVKLIADREQGQGRAQEGDERLPVAVTAKPGEQSRGRVFGSEELPVVSQQESTMTAGRSQSEGVSR